jgi:hypothetical protein
MTAELEAQSARPPAPNARDSAFVANWFVFAFRTQLYFSFVAGPLPSLTTHAQ